MEKNINDYSCYFGLECKVVSVTNDTYFGIVQPLGKNKISIEGKELITYLPLEHISSIVNLKS